MLSLEIIIYNLEIKTTKNQLDDKAYIRRNKLKKKPNIA